MSKIDEITDRVEQDRADLAATLDALTTAVSPTQVTTQVKDTATQLSGELAGKAWSSIRDNPAGGIMTALGLALMAAGPERQPIGQTAPNDPTAVPPMKAFAGFDERVANADDAMKREMTGQMANDSNVSQFRSKIDAGLDQLPKGARDRVTQARRAALSAQDAVDRRARELGRNAKGLMQTQPLAVGAVALGLGLVIGTLLPGTRREDELLGERRDALMDRAQSLFEDEMRNAHAAADRALSSVSGRSA